MSQFWGYSNQIKRNRKSQTLWWECNVDPHFEERLLQFLMYTSIWSTYSTIRYLLKKIETYREINSCAYIFLVSSFIVASNWNQLKCSLTGKKKTPIFYSDNGIPLDNKRVWNIKVYQHFWISKSLCWHKEVKWKQYLLYDSICMKPKNAN